jgi:hypothetical protein
MLRAFIGLQPAPGKHPEDIIFSAFHKAALVGIFYPNNECTSIMPGK